MFDKAVCVANILATCCCCMAGLCQTEILEKAEAKQLIVEHFERMHQRQFRYESVGKWLDKEYPEPPQADICEAWIGLDPESGLIFGRTVVHRSSIKLSEESTVQVTEESIFHSNGMYLSAQQTTFGGLHEGKVGKDLGGKFDWSKERVRFQTGLIDFGIIWDGEKNLALFDKDLFGKIETDHANSAASMRVELETGAVLTCSFSLVQPTPRLVRIEITYPDFLVVGSRNKKNEWNFQYSEDNSSTSPIGWLYAETTKDGRKFHRDCKYTSIEPWERIDPDENNFVEVEVRNGDRIYLRGYDSVEFRYLNGRFAR